MNTEKCNNEAEGNARLPIVSERLFICSRCKTEYTTESKENYIGCCIMPVVYRTSGICGGELVEQT